MSALLFAYNPAHNMMTRHKLDDVVVDETLDLWRAQGLDVSVCWLEPDPPPTVDELLKGLER